MGSTFKLTVCNDSIAKAIFDTSWKEVERIESNISSWLESSEISRINKNAGGSPVVVSEEVYKLLKLSQELHKLSQGAFDLTIKPALKIWDWKIGKIPSNSEIEATRKIIGLDKVILNDSLNTVFLPVKGMQLDLGGIGKGYAAHRLSLLFKDHGISSGAISAGGDLYIVGSDCKNESWNIAIRNPFKSNELVYTLKQTDIAIATSGNYERYFEVDSVRYSHILNPKTCRPIQGVASVTVLAPDPVVADALATALTVMGVQAGLNLVDQLSGVEAIFIQSNGEVFLSKHLVSK